MITRQTKLQLLAFAVVAVLGMSYLGFKYVGLDRLLLGSGYDVAADFNDSGGIFVNAEVTYRGVAVGRVSDMKLIDDGVRVVLTMDPGADDDPGRHPGGRGHPQRRRRAVHPAAARRRRGAVPRGRLGHPEGQDLDPGARRAVAAQHGRARGLARPGEPADRGRRARPGLRRLGRRPGPADRQRQPAARPRRGVAAADAAADHRRPDGPRHPGGEPVGDPAVGVGPAAGDRHASWTSTPTCASSWSTHRTPPPRSRRWSTTPGPGWAPWSATWTS